MFIAAAGGVLVVGIIAHDDHSNYSDHSNHSRHNQYGDAALVQEINHQQKLIARKKKEIREYAGQIEREFSERIQELGQETNYDGLNAEYENILEEVKCDMKKEIEASIADEKAELERIDKLIARINELELNVGGKK